MSLAANGRRLLALKMNLATFSGNGIISIRNFKCANNKPHVSCKRLDGTLQGNGFQTVLFL